VAQSNRIEEQHSRWCWWWEITNRIYSSKSGPKHWVRLSLDWISSKPRTVCAEAVRQQRLQITTWRNIWKKI